MESLGHMFVSVLFVVTMTEIVTAAADQKSDRAWDCWHSASGGKGDAVSLGLINEDGLIKIRGAEFMEYTILEDNEVGLVALRSYAEDNGDTKRLGADVFVIDKKTLEFRKSNVFVKGAGADNTPRQGKGAARR